MNAIQDRCFKLLLGLVGPVPRVVLLHEMGADMRLATRTMCTAASLLSKIELDPRYHAAKLFTGFAKQYADSWTHAVERWMATAGIKLAAEV